MIQGRDSIQATRETQTVRAKGFVETNQTPMKVALDAVSPR